VKNLYRLEPSREPARLRARKTAPGNSRKPHAEAAEPKALNSIASRPPGQPGKPHAEAAEPKALNSIAKWVQRHAASVALTTRSCMTAISSRIAVMYTG